MGICLGKYHLYSSNSFLKRLSLPWKYFILSGRAARPLQWIAEI